MMQPICLMQSGVRPLQGTIGVPCPMSTAGIIMSHGMSAIAVGPGDRAACASWNVGPPMTANTTSTSRKRCASLSIMLRIALRGIASTLPTSQATSRFAACKWVQPSPALDLFVAGPEQAMEWGDVPKPHLT